MLVLLSRYDAMIFELGSANREEEREFLALTEEGSHHVSIPRSYPEAFLQQLIYLVRAERTSE